MAPGDQELVERARAGDSGSFGELVKRYGPGLYGFLVCQLRDRARAEDVYAETFMRAWRGLGRYRERGRFKAWLFTIAHRLCLDDAEREGRRRADSLDDPQGMDETLAERTPGREPGPERLAASATAQKRIEAALAGLPEEQRQVFLMRERGGLSFAEIADALDCPLSTALARMRYAVTKLRKELEDLDA